MPLGTDYAHQDCAIARSLEVVGERWTLLVIRDLFYGVRRYSDLRAHIGLPSATLTDRLNHLIDNGVVERIPGRGARDEYALTSKGEALWPVICGLAQWGNANYGNVETRMRITHRACGALLDDVGACPNCGTTPRATDVVVHKPVKEEGDAVGRALSEPHRLLEPLRF